MTHEYSAVATPHKLLTREGASSFSFRRRFTLIELLVVISIIAVLASMLLPALSQAREKGRQTVCMNNMKGIVFAMHAYGDEYDNWLPMGIRDAWGWQNALWSGAVAYYNGFKYITEWAPNNTLYPENCFNAPAGSSKRDAAPLHPLKCPSETFKNYWGTKMAVSYGWNGESWGCGRSDGWWYRTKDDGTDDWKYENYRRGKWTDMIMPSTTVMTGEWLIVNGMYEYKYYSQFNLTNFATYHNGGANVQWVDGHVSYQKYGSLTADDLDRRY